MRENIIIIAFFIIATQLTGQSGIYHIPSNKKLPKNYLSKTDVKVKGIQRDTAILQATLISDFRQLRRKKSTSEYQKAQLIYAINDTIEVRHQLKLKARGESRRKLCTNPPILLNFKKSDFPNTQFYGLDKVKMVVKCNNNKAFTDYLLREFLAYRIYNLITDKSFKVKLLDITYIDSGKKQDTAQSYAFLIEEADHLAKRLQAAEIKSEGYSQSPVNPENADLHAIFQYLIGNTDWALGNRHNVKIFRQVPTNGKPTTIIVPYDFDFSGLCGTNYSTPREGLNISNVRSRYYLGLCREPEELDQRLQVFRDKKEEIYELVNNFEYLSFEDRASIIKYFDKFYETINSPKAIKRSILSQCKP